MPITPPTITGNSVFMSAMICSGLMASSLHGQAQHWPQNEQWPMPLLFGQFVQKMHAPVFDLHQYGNGCWAFRVMMVTQKFMRQYNELVCRRCSTRIYWFGFGGPGGVRGVHFPVCLGFMSQVPCSRNFIVFLASLTIWHTRSRETPKW
jgi:hypothetical protein